MATPVEPRTQWAIFDDGSVGMWRYEGDTPPALPAPGRIVSQEEYEEARAVITQAVQEDNDQQEAAEREQIRDDYDALLALGMPETTARRLSGYTDPAEDES
ncbi:hypothetical protein [Streptomyces sp. KR55]|uniref:hypothetical protein n=1 Tax=Streptomyces sp. KR55 TaxID=3457425 RepID=UPI003FCF9715